MTGPTRLWRQSYDRDGARALEQRTQLFGRNRHPSGRCRCGVPLTARPTSTIPDRCAIVTARVDGTLGVATHASPARAALNASSAEIRPVTSRPRPTIAVRRTAAPPITLSTAFGGPLRSGGTGSPG